MLMPNNIVVHTKHIEIRRREAQTRTYYVLFVKDDTGKIIGWNKFFDLDKAYKEATLHIKEINRYGKTH